MKKLMIVAALAMAAFASQAAVVDWKVTGEGSTMGSKAYYVFEASQRTTILALLATPTTDGKAGALATSLANASVKSGDLSSGKTASGQFSGFAKDGDVSYFTVILNKGTSTASTATKWYISADATGHAYTVGVTDSDAVTVEMSVPNSNTNFVKETPIDVPEPTSAMLLLLGVAGLALKRKVA